MQATNNLTVSEIRFAAATAGEQVGGLIGFLSFVIGESLRLDGITLRRTKSGRLTLSFPKRTDSNGREHAFVYPIDHHARLSIEEQVFNQLGFPVAETQNG